LAKTSARDKTPKSRPIFIGIKLRQRVPPDMAKISPAKNSLFVTAWRSIYRYAASVTRSCACGNPMEFDGKTLAFVDKPIPDSLFQIVFPPGPLHIFAHEQCV
jgi:hypothetical protein